MSSPVVTRAQAGLVEPRGVSTNIDGSEGVTFHNGGGALGGFPWPHSRCASIWRAWQAFHMSPGALGVPAGGSDIAYSMGACIHGFVFEGRGPGVRTAAQGTNEGNRTSHAVVYMAGAGEALTDAGKRAMLDARAMIRKGARAVADVVHPHRFWHATNCPDEPIVDWIAAGLPDPALVWDPPPQPKMGTALAAFARTPSGKGYILVGVDGGVFTFGDAMYFGSLPELHVVPNKPIVGARISPSGGGYLLAGADGGIYSFGDARYLGSLGAAVLNKPIEAVEVTPSGAGYWLGGQDAGVFTFGDAPFLGSAA